METSEQINELAAALAKAQGQMSGAHKEASNAYFKTRYADLGAVIEAIKAPFADNGLAYVQSPAYADGRVTVTTRILHSSGQWIQAHLSALCPKGDTQTIGAAITYLRRYSLQSLAGVPAVDGGYEPVTTDVGRPREIGTQEAPAGTITADQASELALLVDQAGVDQTAFCLAFGIGCIEELPVKSLPLARKQLAHRVKQRLSMNMQMPPETETTA